ARAAARELLRTELRTTRIALRKDRGRRYLPVGRELQPSRGDDETLARLRSSRCLRDAHRDDLRAVRLERVVVSPLVRSNVKPGGRRIDGEREEVEDGRVADLASVD